MTEDIAQAVAIELQHIVKSDWRTREEAGSFIISPPDETLNETGKTQILIDEAWRIARFVAYADFVSISKLADGDLLIASNMASGNGFKIRIEASRR